MDNLESVRPGYYSIGVVGGQERFIRFDLNAFAEMERIYGSMEAANEALQRGSMADVRRVLWLGLIHDQAELDPITGEPVKYNLTIYEVGKWLTPQNMKQVMEALNKAINASVPDEGDRAAASGLTPAQAATLAAEEEQAKQEVIVTPFPTV